MKVLCIDNKNPMNPHYLLDEDWINEGEIYTVYSSYRDEETGELFYYLEERMSRVPHMSYRANRFLPVQDDPCIGNSPAKNKTNDYPGQPEHNRKTGFFFFRYQQRKFR